MKKLPSSGPYKVDSITDEGAVVLVANDKWWGAPPAADRVTVWKRGADIQDRINNGTFDVVDIAAGSGGLLNLPAGYTRTDTPSAGSNNSSSPHRARWPRCPTGGHCRCAPRATPSPATRSCRSPTPGSTRPTEDALSAAESAGEAGQFGRSNIEGARQALNNQPLTVRIGYQSPNPRLAATVGVIAQACAPAGSPSPMPPETTSARTACATTPSTC